VLEDLYNYRAKIIKVYDGDTVTAKIDLGFKVHFTEKGWHQNIIIKTDGDY